MKKRPLLRSLTSCFLAATVLAGCSSNIVGEKLGTHGLNKKDGIPFHLLKPRLVVTPKLASALSDGKEVDKKQIEFDVKLVYDLPDENQRYILNAKPEYLSNISFGATLGAFGQFESVDATVYSEIPSLIKSMGGFLFSTSDLVQKTDASTLNRGDAVTIVDHLLWATEHYVKHGTATEQKSAKSLQSLLEQIRREKKVVNKHLYFLSAPIEALFEKIQNDLLVGEYKDDGKYENGPDVVKYTDLIATTGIKISSQQLGTSNNPLCAKTEDHCKSLLAGKNSFATVQDMAIFDKLVTELDTLLVAVKKDSNISSEATKLETAIKKIKAARPRFAVGDLEKKIKGLATLDWRWRHLQFLDQRWLYLQRELSSKKNECEGKPGDTACIGVIQAFKEKLAANQKALTSFLGLQEARERQQELEKTLKKLEQTMTETPSKEALETYELVREELVAINGQFTAARLAIAPFVEPEKPKAVAKKPEYLAGGGIIRCGIKNLTKEELEDKVNTASFLPQGPNKPQYILIVENPGRVVEKSDRNDETPLYTQCGQKGERK